MCEKVVIRPGVTCFSILIVLSSGGSGDVGEADFGPGVPNAECKKSFSIVLKTMIFFF